MSHTMEDKGVGFAIKGVKRSTYFLETDKICIWYTGEIK